MSFFPPMGVHFIEVQCLHPFTWVLHPILFSPLVVLQTLQLYLFLFQLDYSLTNINDLWFLLLESLSDFILPSTITLFLYLTSFVLAYYIPLHDFLLLCWQLFLRLLSWILLQGSECYKSQESGSFWRERAVFSFGHSASVVVVGGGDGG